jgi:hypothetical protein
VTAQAVMVGVWGRAFLLLGLFYAFLTTSSTVDDDDPPRPDSPPGERPALATS